MKKLLANIGFIVILSSQTFAAQTLICNGTKENPCVVRDTIQNPKEIKYWRTAKMLYDNYKGNTLGLDKLWISVSAQPSVNGLKEIARYINQSTHKNYIKMFDLDLREESHGFLNNDAITLTIEHDWINLGNPHQRSLRNELSWLKTLTTNSIVFNVLTSDQFKSKHYSQGIDIKVESATDEKQIAEIAGFEYVRLTITDHMAPRDDDTDRFVNFIKNLPENSWVHIHCRGGEGRTSTIFVMYDMMKNADMVSFDEIIKRQTAIDPFYDLSDTTRSDPELTKYYEARYEFLKRFYLFAQDYLRGYQRNWSDWKKDHQ